MANDSEDSPMKLVRKPQETSQDQTSTLLREVYSFLALAAEAGLYLRLEDRPQLTQSEETGFLLEHLSAIRRAWQWRSEEPDLVAKLTSGGAVLLTERESRQMLQLTTELLRKSRKPDLEALSARTTALALHLDMKVQETRELQEYLADLTTENDLLRSENATLRQQVAHFSDDELTCTSKFGSSDLDEARDSLLDYNKENKTPCGHRSRAPTFSSGDFAKCLCREELKRS